MCSQFGDFLTVIVLQKSALSRLKSGIPADKNVIELLQERKCLLFGALITIVMNADVFYISYYRGAVGALVVYGNL